VKLVWRSRGEVPTGLACTAPSAAAVQDIGVTLPTGDVTFFFSDIEGSTRLAQALGDRAWAALLRAHDQSADSAIWAGGGAVVKHEGDGVFAAFPDALGALTAAVIFSRALHEQAFADQARPRVRIGVHTGEGRVTESGQDYVGIDVHYAARVSAAANGGQIAVSEAARDRLAGSLPAGTQLLEMGPRRLKDFEDPRPIHLLVIPGIADDERPLRTIDAPTNLPSPPTNFVGREDDLAALRGILDSTRLLTLTGPGGTGKTRLGIGLAASVADAFPGGTWFVDLAPVRDPSLLQSTIAAALDVREEPGVPISRTLQAHLQPLQVLLVLDNLEQLLPRSGGDIAELLRASPGLRIVVTSREVLRIAGEHEYQVAPLDPIDGIQLFVDRASLVRPDAVSTSDDLAVVRRIVERLEGLPLAIELAAARIRLFGPAAILERLETSLDLLAGGARDLPERQRTLRGAISWSHDLLSEDERAVFRRVSVFSGGWSADIAQEVVDPDGDLGLLVADGLETLSDKSLVKVRPTDHGEPRFERHTLLREFAEERLEQSGERPDCERRHALAFLAVAETAGPRLMTPDADRWYDRLEHEQHNLRAALRWSLTMDEPDIGMRIIASIWRFWQRRSELAEGASWAAELLAHPLSRRDPRVRIGALSAAGGIAYWANDFAIVKSAYEERLALAEALDDTLLLADAHYEMGFLGVIEKNPEMLQHHTRLALELYERAGSEDGMVRARQSFVLNFFVQKRFAEAREMGLLNLEAVRRMGARSRVSDSLMLLAVASIFVDDLEAGRRYLTESERLTSGIVADEITGLTIASHLALRSDLPEDGARLAGAAQQLRAETGVTNIALAVLQIPDPIVIAEERLGDRAEELVSQGRSMTMDVALEVAREIAAPRETASLA
jgi:predicted ATPase/class 3 adenylate cyclase